MLLVAEEGIADTVVPRLDMAGADRSRIFAFKAEHVANKQNFNWLREQLKKSTDTRLVVIDPLTGFLGATDPNANHEVRMRMQDLAAIAEECSVAILCLLHHSKALHSRAVHRVAGATSFTGVARMALAVCKDDADPDRRLLMPVKNNHGKGGVALPFRVIAPETDMPKVEWEEKLVRVNADEALTHDLARTRNRQIGEADRALAFLRETLANGPMAQTDVMKLAKERQISERTIDRVKHRALVLSKKLASGWVWSIEPKSEPTEDGGTVGTVGILGTVGTLPTPDLPPFPVPVSMRVGG
jgi:putative DNA primase/helicase